MSASSLAIDPPPVFVIIPAYNEGEVLEQVVDEILARSQVEKYRCEVVIIDDGSSDETAQIVAGLPVHLLRHVVNLGQGAALATGIQYALGQGAQVLVTFDADGQHDPADIRKLVEPVIAGEADVALGSRFLAGALGVPRRRRMLLKIAILFTGLTDHIWLSDAHNGLRALSASAARQIRITQNRMAHASEIVSEIARLKLRYVEVPVQVRYTDYSQHKGQRATDALNIMIELLEERLRF
jgi:glycosyltransferase involved in cell wall biosynthesis